VEAERFGFASVRVLAIAALEADARLEISFPLILL
jgi:hypothetical protein